MQGWTQKALVGTFMGGLKSEIVEGIRMFKPKTLMEAINLARMKDEQLSRQWRVTRSFPQPLVDFPPNNAKNIPKRLTWEEMQKKRELGLCFNFNEKFAKLFLRSRVFIEPKNN